MPTRRRTKKKSTVGDQSDIRTQEQKERDEDYEKVERDVEESPQGKAFIDIFQRLGADIQSRHLMMVLMRMNPPFSQKLKDKDEGTPATTADMNADAIIARFEELGPEGFGAIVEKYGLRWTTLGDAIVETTAVMSRSLKGREQERKVAREKAKVIQDEEEFARRTEESDRMAAELIGEVEASSSKSNQREANRARQHAVKEAQKQEEIDQQKQEANDPDDHEGRDQSGVAKDGEEGKSSRGEGQGGVGVESEGNGEMGGEKSEETGDGAGGKPGEGTDVETGGETGEETGGETGDEIDDGAEWTTVGPTSNSTTRIDPREMGRMEVKVGMILLGPHMHQTDVDTYNRERRYTVWHREVGHIYAKWRKFLVIGLYVDHIVALPCFTFGGHGLAGKEQSKNEYVSVFDHRQGSFAEQEKNKQSDNKPLMTRDIPGAVGPWHPGCVAHICEPVSFDYRTEFGVQGSLEQTSLEELYDLYRRKLPHRGMAPPWLGPRGSWASGPRSRDRGILADVVASLDQRGARGSASRGARGSASSDGRGRRGTEGPYLSEFLSSQMPPPPLSDSKWPATKPSQENPRDTPDDLLNPFNVEGPTAMATAEELERLFKRTHIIGRKPLEDPLSRSPSPSSTRQTKKERRVIEPSYSIYEFSKEKGDHNLGVCLSQLLGAVAEIEWKETLAYYKEDPTEERFEALEDAEESCDALVTASEQMLQKIMRRFLEKTSPALEGRAVDPLLFR